MITLSLSALLQMDSVSTARKTLNNLATKNILNLVITELFYSYRFNIVVLRLITIALFLKKSYKLIGNSNNPPTLVSDLFFPFQSPLQFTTDYCENFYSSTH